jgi:hypothetical protein
MPFAFPSESVFAFGGILRHSAISHSQQQDIGVVEVERPQVERFFRDLTEQRLRRGIFRDAEELIMAIGEYIDKHNDSPKPFVWTAKASDVLEKVRRARAVLDNG